ncbi:uncharacterized protein BROUX77_006479 [Berkeleyomyces rouxiae]|uniref:uncharacterized protein n=1 Tax=Berkeleyomyces rouxiae TaxID=2035830 RepID=UPI003B7DECFB
MSPPPRRSRRTSPARPLRGSPFPSRRVATGAKRVRSEDAPLPQEAPYAPISLPVGRLQALADKIRTKQDAEAAAKDRLASISMTMADNCLAAMAPQASAHASTHKLPDFLQQGLLDTLQHAMTGAPQPPPNRAPRDTTPSPAPQRERPAPHRPPSIESSDKESWSTVARKGRKASKAAPTDNRLFVVVPTDSPLRKLSPAYIVTKANAGIPRGEGAGTATATKTGFALTAVRDVGKFLSHAERIRANLTAEKVHKRDAWSKYIVHGLPTSITVEDPKTPSAVIPHRVTLDDVTPSPLAKYSIECTTLA